jgi:hypothetical protein
MEDDKRCGTCQWMKFKRHSTESGFDWGDCEKCYDDKAEPYLDGVTEWSTCEHWEAKIG